MAKVLEKKKVINLRRQGWTYRNILKKMPGLSKSTVSRWCNEIELSDKEWKKLQQNMAKSRDKARFQSILTNRKKRLERDKAIMDETRKEFEHLQSDPIFTFGLALYWAEGAKKSRHFHFMNSDPRLIIFMINWITTYLRVPKEKIKFRLYIHEIYKKENCEAFWIQVTKTSRDQFLKTIFKPTPHKVKKNPDYKGCLRIDIGVISFWLKVMAWEQCFQEARM